MKSEAVIKREKQILKLKCICLLRREDFTKEEVEKVIIRHDKSKDKKERGEIKEKFCVHFGTKTFVTPDILEKICKIKRWDLLSSFFPIINEKVKVLKVPLFSLKEYKKLINQCKLFELFDGGVGYLDIRINLNHTKTDIMKEVNRLLVKHSQKINRCDNVDFFERCLKTYDLYKMKKSEGKYSFEKLAHAIYRNQPMDASVKQVKREFNVAKTLIGGGYMKMK